MLANSISPTGNSSTSAQAHRRDAAEQSENALELLSRRRLWSVIHDIRIGPANNLHRPDLRVKLHASGLAFRLRQALVCSLTFKRTEGHRTEWRVDGKDVASMERFLKQLLHGCLLIASKMLDVHPIAVADVCKAECFKGFTPRQVANVELEILIRLKYEIARTRPMLLFEEAASLIAPLCSNDEELIQGRVLDILHLHFCDARSHVFDVVQYPLLGAGIFAAAYAVAKNRAPGALLYALCASRTAGPFWDVSELQLVANAILDNTVESAAVLRYNLIEAADHVLAS